MKNPFLSSLALPVLTSGVLFLLLNTGRAIENSLPASSAGSNTFMLTEAADVSLALYDGEGRMVRELARAVPMEAGMHVVQWDGLDREGQPVPPGEYTWKLLSSQGLETEYVMSLGTSVGFNHWPGVHGGPSAVTVHGDTMYMAGAGSEAAMGIAAADLDGTFAWAEHSLRGWGAALDAAVVGDKVWYQYGETGRSDAAAREDGANLKQSLENKVPVRTIDLTETAPKEYDEETGFGWASLEGITAVASEATDVSFFKGGHRVTAADPKSKVSFVIDLPEYVSYARRTFYEVRLFFGGGEGSEGTPTLGLQKNGQWATTYPRADYPPEGGVVVINAEPSKGKLELTFYVSGTPGPLDFVLCGIEVSALANRMDAIDDQMVVAADGASTLLWVDPENKPTARLPAYADLTISENIPQYRHAWKHDGGPGGLQSAVPGSFPDHSFFSFQMGGAMDLKLAFSDDQPHQLALYFDRARSEVHDRSMRVQLLDPVTGDILDTREVADFGDGKYLVWNLRKAATVRITSTGSGGPLFNAVFLDPSTIVMTETQTVQFVKTDAETHGSWLGTYGSDGYYIIGDLSSVVDTAAVPDIRDVEIQPDGSLVAISGNNLVTLSRENKTPVVQVQNLEAPAILAVDQGNGDILVMLEGEAQQIVRFDKDFNLINTYGRRGGRREGRYIATDFAGVADIASDNKGGFLVAEWMSAPRRTAYFNRAGELQHEWYGGQMFYYSPGIDPEDPSNVWLNSQFGWLFEMKVDYESKTYKVVSTWNMKEQLDPVLFQAPNGFWIWTQPLTIQGERYLAYEGAHALLLKPDYENGRLVPVSAASVARKYNMGGEAQLAEIPDEHPWKIAMQETWDARTNYYDRRILRQFGYVDRNGDLEMQPDEFILDPDQTHHGEDYGYGSFIDSDLTAWRWGYTEKASLWYRIPVSGTLDNGLPIWNYADKQIGPSVEDVRAMHLLPEADGSLYFAEVREGDGFGIWWHQTTWEGHGFGWPATMINESVLTRRNPEGEELWSAGAHHSGFPGPKGRVDLPWRIAGKVDDVLGLTSQTRQPCEFFTTDGLYIGGVLDKRADDGLPPRVYAWWQVNKGGEDTPDNVGTLRYDLGQSGKIARGPDGGLLFFGSGRNNLPVYRINGFDAIDHQTGTLQIKETSSAAAGTGTGLKGEYFANPELAGEPAASRTDADVWFGFASKAGAEKSYRIPWPEPDITSKPFSVRWTGMLEPKFTEDTVIGFYDRDSGVRVWINDELVIDDWEDNGKKEHSAPIPMVAGQKLPIRIEWRQVKDKKPEAHLVWESLSQPIAHVAGEYLYSLGE